MSAECDILPSKMEVLDVRAVVVVVHPVSFGQAMVLPSYPRSCKSWRKSKVYRVKTYWCSIDIHINWVIINSTQQCGRCSYQISFFAIIANESLAVLKMINYGPLYIAAAAPIGNECVPFDVSQYAWLSLPVMESGGGSKAQHLSHAGTWYVLTLAGTFYLVKSWELSLKLKLTNILSLSLFC